MLKTYSLLLLLLLSTLANAQKIETIHPLTQESGDTLKQISKTAKFNESYLFLSKDKKTVYKGENLENLRVANINKMFHQVLDTSRMKKNANVEFIEVKWDELFFYYHSFILADGDLGLSGEFVTESYRDEDVMLPFHKAFIIIFDNLLNIKAIRFVELPSLGSETIITNIFSVGKSNIVVEVKNQESTSLPVFIGVQSSNAEKVLSFPPNFKLPRNNYRNVLTGIRFQYSSSFSNHTYSLYSNGYEIIDMEKQEIFFVSPDSTMILSPILFVENQPCVVVATINMEQMKNSNYRYVSVLDGSFVKAVDHSNLPSFYIHNLTGLSYSEQGPYLGFRNIEGKPHLIHFTP